MFSGRPKTSSRQRKIVNVVLRHGWSYMRGLLLGGKAEEPSLPPPRVLCNILVDLGPVYVKLGQLLSTRPDLLPPTYIEALTSLQAEVPPVAWEAVETVIRKQLPQPLAEIFAIIHHQPVAAGSIAQTHRATLVDGREVAVKIQRPGIDKVVEQDIRLLRGLARLVNRTQMGQYYNLIAIVEEFASALRAELNFTQEASYTDLLRRNLSKSFWFDPQQLVLPEIYWDLTSDKLLVMEWLSGVPLLLADFKGINSGGDGTAERRAIADLLLRAYFQQFYIDGVFHADPHPGNLFYLESGRIALIDFGLMGRLDPRTQQILIELILAIANLDSKRCSQLTLDLADSTELVNLAYLQNDFDRLLRRYYNFNLSEINFSQLIYQILQIARKHQIRLPSNMGLYAKTLANLEGVTRQLNPDFNLIEQIKPLMADLFRQRLVGHAPLQDLLRTALDIKTLSLDAPRQVEMLLDRVTSETLQWNVALRGLEPFRRSLHSVGNRLTFGIVTAAILIGAAMIFSQAPSNPVFFWVSGILFVVASLIGLWLIVSMIRSGRVK
ncbi:MULTISPECIES: ABC1 kinase family protein [unclassified Coleofasciculus]|uniref:ABC1 kinase family protein n=1 Tax=unclassified Coleofasciculus TaxID=2692782 RepID=UPI00187FCB95|nr:MULTISPECIES: AarF/ABC1/UbiB kinase family protein [unclassified Coleofasciculus]MBE9127809.1 AarF/ABC1/UbiB kinase family protein [Coleofasciculus sp. LEGE 07081]MBE9150050.1 AarF/ABC1/UbiB kinase family protein [Coleofasciculus sp. LEGE 07092]